MIKQVKEADKTMSRAAKGHEKYGKEGMQALAKAGKEGKSLDPIRKKYDKYSEEVKEGSDWETTHDQFTTVGNRATPEQINKITSALDGVAEHKGVKHKYQMTHSDGSKMKFTAKDDADARRQAKEHDAKSVSKFKGGAYTDKVAEGGFFDPDRPNIGDVVKHKHSGAMGRVKKIGTQGDTTTVYFKDAKTGAMNYGEWKKHVFPIKQQGVAEGSFGSGFNGPFTAVVNTGERPKSRTKTKKFRREDDAILWSEDWLEDFPQYVYATIEVKDSTDNVVWQSNDEQGVAEETGDKPFDNMMKKVTKTPTAKARNTERIRQKREREEETRDRLKGGFGPSPADKLSIREPKEGSSGAMANAASRLVNKDDGKVAKLRAAGDKRREDQLKSRNIAKKNEDAAGVAEHKGVKHKYQMTHSDGSKMKFTAKDDADARRQAKEHDATRLTKQQNKKKSS